MTARSGTARVTAMLAPTLAAAHAVAAEDLFETPWLGFNVGVSAYPGNAEAFERDPTAMATADLDMDGRLDVVVANVEYAAPGGGTDGMSGFAVIFGTGDRRFSPPVHRTVSNDGCWDVVTGDVDADGDPDVAVSISDTFYEGSQVRVYLDDGNGAFPTFRSQIVADGPIGLAATDFDGDGDLDLAVASYRWDQSEGIVSLLRGDGTGSLGSPETYLVGQRPWKLESGDLDGDGDADLAVAHELQEVSVLLNAGDGTFPSLTSHAGFYPLQSGMAYPAVTLADGDRDGDLDIFYTNTRAGEPTIPDGNIVHLLNDGAGTFTMTHRIGEEWAIVPAFATWM